MLIKENKQTKENKDVTFLMCNIEMNTCQCKKGTTKNKKKRNIVK